MKTRTFKIAGMRCDGRAETIKGSSAGGSAWVGLGLWSIWFGLLARIAPP